MFPTRPPRPRRPPGPAALHGRRCLRQRPAAFRGVRGKSPATPGRMRPRWWASRSTKWSAKYWPAVIRDHRVGDRVVGWASGFDGLMGLVVADGDGLAPYDPALSAQHAVALQPLACVLYALEQLGDLKGQHVAVIGQGSIGLLFSYAAKALGARHVTGVDPVDRDGSARSSASTPSSAPPATAGSAIWSRATGPTS